MASLLGLPPVPLELKPVTPFLQRADELAKQDKVISYWCTYYAAQVGISLKVRDVPARDFLFNLLGVLESMKSAIGPNDAIDIETVSAAYVENFALKVFANADNEDRSGKATRSTAKKFLAASNFLEVLKVFPKSDVSEANEDKIRYSKWKAAEIAKAFREGRKPAPGPPGWAEEQEELKQILQDTEEPQDWPEVPTFPSAPSGPTSSSPTRSTHIDVSTPRHSPNKRSPKSTSPPKPSHINLDRSLNGWHAGAADPETWSNAATPGGDPPDTAASVYTIGSITPSTAGYDFQHPESPTRNTARGNARDIRGTTKPRSGSGSSSNTLSSTGSKGVLKKPASKTPSPDSDKRVHFSPSTAGTPAAPPAPHLPHLPHLPSGSPPRQQYTGPNSIYAPPVAPISPPYVVYPSHVSPTTPHQPGPPPPPASSSSPTLHNYIYGPPNPPVKYAPPPPPAPAVEVEVELTPALISKAQKHCRFAISSLDYEDAEQAKKELRAALALLGG